MKSRFERVYAERSDSRGWQFGQDGEAEWYKEGTDILKEISGNISEGTRKVALVYDKQKRTLSFVRVRTFCETRAEVLNKMREEAEYNPNERQMNSCEALRVLDGRKFAGKSDTPRGPVNDSRLYPRAIRDW